MDQFLSVASNYWWTALWLILLGCIVHGLSLIWFAYIPYRVLKRTGIKGPTPLFFFGNYKAMAKKGKLKYLEYLQNTYGQVAGYFSGRQLYVMVTDLELVKAIMIEDFDYFTDRIDIPASVMKSMGLPPDIFATRGDNWRRARRILSSSFTSSKLKMAENLILKSTTVLVETMKRQANTGKSTEIFKIFGAFTMETILSTAFGRDVKVQSGESNVLTEAAAAILTGTSENSSRNIEYMKVITSNFPFLSWVLQKLAASSPYAKGLVVLSNATREILKRRQIEKLKCRDILQLMMDAEAFNEDGSDKPERLSNEEIIAFSIGFFLAGYETTATTLTCTSYLLALHPNIQEKLQQEIDEYFSDNPKASLYEAAQEIKYLDMVINEVLRLYSPVPVLQRICVKEYRYKDMIFPKGSIAVFPLTLLHKDEEHWENSDEFDVNRFSPEEKAKHPQRCFMPFGTGPRSCLGMRLALTEVKIALMQLMKEVTFVRSSETEVPLKTTVGLTMSPANSVYVEVSAR